jgi:hypothetical protein
MRRWLITTLFLSITYLLALPTAAHAQDKEKAVKLLKKGDALLEKGDRYWAANKPEKGLAAYEEALAVYNEAHDAFPSPKIYYPIAEAEQKLGLYLEAMRHYQAMLKETENPEPALVEQVDAAIAEVRKNLSGLELIVEQDGAEVQVDGKNLGTTPLDGIHYFSAGKHKYSVTLEGHTPIEETLETKRGEVVTRDVSLDRMPVVVKPKKEKPKVVDDSPLDKKPLTISFGVAGGLLAVAGFTAVQAMARHDRYQDEANSIEDRENARKRGKQYRLATDVFLGGAVLAAGYGTYYYYTKYKPKKNQEKESLAKVWVSPYASGDGGGVAMGASF